MNKNEKTVNYFNALTRESRTLYFDMDGTIADLYSVKDWLPKLEAGDPSPYIEARKLVNLCELGAMCCELKAMGYKIGIVSWLCKGATKEYDKLVRQAKRDWLKKNFPIRFDEVHIVKYGTPKHYIVKDKNGFLFDDEERNCKGWKGVAVNAKENDIVEYIENLLRVLRQ